jgi:hypothetical protein
MGPIPWLENSRYGAIDLALLCRVDCTFLFTTQHTLPREFGGVPPFGDRSAGSASVGFVRQILPLPVTPAVKSTLSHLPRGLNRVYGYKFRPILK